MTLPIRSLVVLGALGLWGACSEEAPAKKAPSAASSFRSRAEEPRASTEQRAALQAPTPPTLEKKPDLPDLSTTAQEKPHSILHTPPENPPSSQVVAEPVTAPTPEEQKPTDFDRALDPSEVQIGRFVLATDVAQREPVGETDTFTTDTKQIFAFVEFANEHAAPYALRVHWESVDGPTTPYGFKFEVPTAARWRTWSWTRIQRAPGHYRAVLRTLKGEEVASREFEIRASDEDCSQAAIVKPVDDGSPAF